MGRARPSLRVIEAEPSAEAERVGLGRSSPPLPPGQPRRHGRDFTRVVGPWAIVIAGLALLVGVVAAPEGALANAATAGLGALAIAMGAMLLADVADARLIGMVGLLTGAALGISALIGGAIDGLEVGWLVGGAMLFMGSGGVLAVASVPVEDKGGE
jgi:hypothetical protein